MEAAVRERQGQSHYLVAAVARVGLQLVTLPSHRPVIMLLLALVALVVTVLILVVMVVHHQ
ncbi:hypothetical protein DMR34_32215 [Klebsiella variicola]|nr:hypothetical protein DMR34_32215 [Klebsiella variicola]